MVSFDHDPLGRRVAKKINGAVTEKYLWSGLTQLLAVYDSSDNLVIRFTYADSRMPVSMTTSGGTYYLTYDQVGSLRAVTDSSGTLVKQIVYDTFGNIISDSNPTFTVPFGFAGGLHDRDTNLVRFGFRDYDPEVGRWTAKDPIGFSGGDTDLYGYLEGDSVNWIDPHGLQMQTPGYPVGYPLGNPIQMHIPLSPIQVQNPKLEINTQEIIIPQNNKDIPMETDTEISTENENNICPKIDQSINYSQGKGERGQTSKPSGTGNPYKHMRPHPTDPTKVIFKDPHTGKNIIKPKPKDFPER